MVYFQAKNPKLGKFWSVLQRKMLVNFMAMWSILLPFGIFCGHLVCFVVILVYFSSFGMLWQEKSGNPVSEAFSAAFCKVQFLRRSAKPRNSSS
jgi:hypothetical protein